MPGYQTAGAAVCTAGQRRQTTPKKLSVIIYSGILSISVFMLSPLASCKSPWIIST